MPSSAWPTRASCKRKWTDEINDEWIEAVMGTRDDVERAKLERILADYGISAEQPDEFLVGLVDINERLVAQARREQWMALKRPPLTKAQFSILSAPQPRPEVAAIRDLIY
jgi:hypothetical protein